MVTEGYIYDVKNKLAYFISQADATLQPQDDHVYLNWTTAIYKLTQANFPVVTLRIMPSAARELVYGRKTKSNETGVFIIVSFTAHVFAMVKTTGNAKAKDAMDLADKIETILLQSTDSATGIQYIYDITKRESEPDRGAKRVSRIIMTGRILVKKPL